MEPTCTVHIVNTTLYDNALWTNIYIHHENNLKIGWNFKNEHLIDGLDN